MKIVSLLPSATEIKRQPRVTFLEWLDPPFSAGHWNPELIRLAGGIEGLGKEGEKSRQLQWREIKEWQPEVILVACCGFDIERTCADLPGLKNLSEWRSLPAVKQGRVFIVDGSHYFNRPGPRLVDSLELAAHVIDPELHPLPTRLPKPCLVNKEFLN